MITSFAFACSRCPVASPGASVMLHDMDTPSIRRLHAAQAALEAKGRSSSIALERVVAPGPWQAWYVSLAVPPSLS